MAEQPLLIDPSDPVAIQSRHALMIADEERLVMYREPIDTRDATQVARLRAELGDDCAMPEVAGVYYFLYVLNEHEQHVPVLIPEGQALAFVFALAVKRDSETARRLLFMRGILPA